MVGILLGAWAARLYALTVQNIWWDEARNIDVALRPLLQVATAPELDIHPPVYFWMLHGWGRLAGVSMALEPEQIAYLMRFASVWFGVCGVALLYALTLHLGVRWTAMLAAGIGALSPFWLAESQEARMYTVGFALLMAAALCLLRATNENGPTVETSSGTVYRGRSALWPLAGFAFFCALALITHYNAVFILVAWYAWWGAQVITAERGTRLRQVVTLVMTGIVTLLLVLPVAPIAMRQIPGYENPNLTVPSVGQYLWQNWQAYIGGYAFDADRLSGALNAWLLAVLVLFAGGLLLRIESVRFGFLASIRSRFSFVFFWLAGGLALYYVAVLDRGAFNVRYSSFVTPALYALLAVALTNWGRAHRGAAAAGAALVLAGFVVGVSADLNDERFAREDIAGVVHWLRENAGANDVVLVDQKYPFGFYYDRYAIDEDANPVGSELAPARYLFVDINDIDRKLADWAADAEHVFWVQWFESDTDPRRSVPFLLDQVGERQGEENFRGYSIDWWRLDPPNEFRLASGLSSAVHQFEQAVQTREVSLPGAPIRPGEKLPVVIRWQRVPGGQVDRPLKARLALYDSNGARLAQADTRILNDRHLLPDEWSENDAPLNVYSVDLPEDLAPGQYVARLLVYDADSLEPLSWLDDAGNPAGVEVDLGIVKVVGDE